MRKSFSMSATPFNALKSPTKPIAVPSWMIWLQCFAFAILYGIWAVPETILIRHVCLILGGLIGIYEIYIYRDSLLKRAALPIYLIAFLFIWTMIQFFFITPNPALQWEELTGTWKRTAIGFVFALGFGLALAGQVQDSHQGRWRKAPYWWLIYIGFMLPTIIYLLKWVLTFKAQQWGIVAPEYLKLHYESAPFYMPKTVYVAFCLPLVAISLGQISLKIQEQQWRPWSLTLNLSACAAVLFVFYAENIKNGVAYALMLTMFFCAIVILRYRSRIRVRETFFVLALIASLAFFALDHIKKNESWSSLFADLRIAVQVDRYEQWKFNGERGYPNNELGKMVSVTNYERIAWGVVGTELLFKNPLGYGLIERSFGHLAKEQWPESKLHQNHSGWLDLALGFGLPGMALILGALAIALRRCIKSPSAIAHLGFWLLLSLALLWCTTEVSQKVYFDWLIFAIIWVSAFSMDVITLNASTQYKIELDKESRTPI
jgi:hypothetical protein